MLVIIKSMRELSFCDLMEVYAEDNQKRGWAQWPGESERRQIALAEQDFYGYLRECFFATPGAAYYVWVAEGKYVSAFRLEPYRDGRLLAALETAPDQRGKGYASALVRAVLASLEPGKIYSHIDKSNAASAAIHEMCGFHKELDHAAYIDGSVSDRAWTYLKEI